MLTQHLISLTAFISILGCGPLIAAEFMDAFERLKKIGDAAEIQTLLRESQASEKDNPDYYALSGNYWWQLSKSVSITRKPSEGDHLSVRDPDSGEEVGSISTVGGANPEIPKRALDLLIEGANRFPHRADIVLGLAFIQRETGAHKECVETLLKLLAFSKKNPADLRWTKNAALPSDASEFIPEAIQGHSAYLYQGEAAHFDDLCAKLCDATIAAFPAHPFAYNIKAALAIAYDKHDAALQYLELAHAKAPDDPLILLNLGDTYLKVGKIPEAAKVFESILKMENIDDALKQEARKAIKSTENTAP